MLLVVVDLGKRGGACGATADVAQLAMAKSVASGYVAGSPRSGQEEDHCRRGEAAKNLSS